MSKFNPIICVDFDGVIHSYSSGWKGVSVIPDPPVEGAIEWLIHHLPIPEAIAAMAPPHNGPIVQIYSSRSKSWFGRRAMKKWLIKHGLPACYIADGILKFPIKKPAAFLTIDDRAICFNGKFPTKEEMLSFLPWNKRPALGATGQFPEGKDYSDDEGELRFGIAHDRDNVVLNFGTPVAWLAFSPKDARQIAETLIKHANEIER